jgi:AraC-like DNA-binding protein
MEAANYNFNIYNSLIFAGILQGLIFGTIVAFSKKYRNTCTLILAAMIVVFSLHNLQYYLSNTYLVRNRYFYGIYWTPGQLILAPMMLFYGLKLLHPEKPIARKTIILSLLPFVIGLLAIDYLKITYAYIGHKAIYITLEAIIELAGILLTASILAWLLREIRRVERDAKGFGIDQGLPKLQWFRNIVTTFFILCFVWLAVFLDMVLYHAKQEIWYIMWISLSVMIYWLGHVGIYKYGVNEEFKKIRNHSLNRNSVMIADKQKSEHLAAFEELLVHKKYYLNPDITLDSLAEELNLSKSHLSRLINKELQTSFPDYINNLRIEEAKYYLRHPDFANYTLVSIGLEAGFASKTTFNNTFKKVTGMTPSEYKNSDENAKIDTSAQQSFL